ncbi:MAG: hypothetical protein ACLU6Z_03905 [Odoribacter splanchnicus]
MKSFPAPTQSFAACRFKYPIAYHTALSSQSTEKSAFRVDYLRLEVSGDVTDRIYYNGCSI